MRRVIWVVIDETRQETGGVGGIRADAFEKGTCWLHMEWKKELEVPRNGGRGHSGAKGQGGCRQPGRSAHAVREEHGGSQSGSQHWSVPAAGQREGAGQLHALVPEKGPRPTLVSSGPEMAFPRQSRGAAAEG